MFSSAEKTSKATIVARKQATGSTFFRKGAEDTFFGAKEAPAFFNTPIQAKLSVSTPDDPHEKEADHVAEQVMRMPEPAAVQPVKEEDGLQRKEEETH